MGLSQRKEKQVIRADPRNTAWASDTQKFGFRMLSQLGWDPSSGLGTAGQGSASALKASLKRDTLGLGAGRAAQDEYWKGGAELGSVLARLNQSSKTEEEVRREEDEVGRKMGHANAARAKYRRAKAQVSAASMNEILGISPSATPATSTPAASTSGSPEPDSEESHPAQKNKANLSVAEYFRMKMLQKIGQLSMPSAGSTFSGSPSPTPTEERAPAAGGIGFAGRAQRAEEEKVVEKGEKVVEKEKEETEEERRKRRKKEKKEKKRAASAASPPPSPTPPVALPDPLASSSASASAPASTDDKAARKAARKAAKAAAAASDGEEPKKEKKKRRREEADGEDVSGETEEERKRRKRERKEWKKLMGA